MSTPLIGTHTPDKLMGGDTPGLVTKAITVLSGQVVARGDVLGKISVGAVPTTGTAGTNAGSNGTCGSVTGGRRTKVGIYTATCVQVITDGGIFSIKNPDGKIIGYAWVGVAFVSDEINLTLADGSNDFDVGDTFTVTVPAGSGHYRLIDKDAINGSAEPDVVALEAIDATDAALDGIVAEAGCFNETEMNFGDTTADLNRDALRLKGIYLAVNKAVDA